MTALERRLQLLLDQRRYDRVAAEAKRSGRSVSAVIRSAIDVSFPSDEDERRSGIADLLALSVAAVEPGEDWATMKEADAVVLDTELTRD